MIIIGRGIIIMNLSKREREQLERENIIIETATELFSEHGFENVTMDTVANKADFTKRTIYRYFSSKEDLFYATALKGHQYLYDMLSASSNKGNTGYEKISLLYYTYYEFIVRYPKHSQIVNSRRYTRTENLDQTSPYYKKFNELDRKLFESLRQTFLSGKEDGSIRSDVDIHKLAFSSIYITVGFFNLATTTGDTFTKHFGFEKDEFIKFSIDRLLETIKVR